MAKETVAQVALLLQDFDAKLQNLDSLLFDAFLLNRDLIIKIRSVYDPLQNDDLKTH